MVACCLHSRPQCAKPLKTRCFVAQQLWHANCNVLQVARLLEILITSDKNAQIMFYTTVALLCDLKNSLHFAPDLFNHEMPDCIPPESAYDSSYTL